MTRQKNADLLIVGGGVLGSFFAYHAQARGLSVILLERQGAPIGATVRNFGQVVPSGLSGDWQPWGLESLKIYQTIQSRFDISVRQQGTIYLASNEEELTLINELHAINSSSGYLSQLWSAAQCCERYPKLRPDYCLGGLFFPDEISVNPRLMIHQLHKFLSATEGIEIRYRTCVFNLVVDREGSVKATTNAGEEIHADQAIVCCGSEFQTLFPQEFLASDLQAVKLQMLRLSPQPSHSINLPGNILTGLSIRRYESFAECPSWQAIKSGEPIESFAKKWGVHILFKQEADGGIILGDSHEYASVAQSHDLGFDLRSDINQFMIDEATKIFDLPSWKVETSWFGIYSQSKHPSGIFTKTIDEQIRIVTGIGGKGMTSSPGFTKHFLKEVYDD